MTACPDKSLLLQAHADGELDAANALALEAHLRSCAACAEELARIDALRALLAAPELDHPAPEALRERIEAMIDAEAAREAAARQAPEPASPRPRRRGAGLAGGAMAFGRSWGGGLVAGLALSAAAVLVLPRTTGIDSEDQFVASHVRSLSLDSHLVDVATSNRHVVKPWFNGKIDFAPPVPELAAFGFPLVGGRLDYVDGREVAVIVYKRRLHAINLFVRPAGALTLPVGVAAKHDGYSLVRWTAGGMEFWAVSDMDLKELELFRRTFASQPSL
ncbi:MAG: anti-sigma factor [Caulobacteraceae bacterium]|nr:anti-sigma factor [Caulobacteraceae bacterium]